MRQFALVVALGCYAAIGARAAASLTVGPNINVTRTAGNNAEETIAINPLNPSNLFVSETWSLATKYSTNGGVTWFNSNLAALPSSIGDVSASWDNFGNLFLVRFGPSEHVVAGISTNGGATFSLLYQGSSTGNDQPTIVVGPSGVAGQGSVWINYTDSANRPVALGAKVTGLGTVGTFGAVQAAPGPGTGFGDIAVGPNGQVMVVYQNNGSGEGPDTIRVNVDPDGPGAAGFGAVINATTTQVGGWALIAAQPNRSIDAEAGLAWDCSGGPHNGRVYLVYTDRPSTASEDTDIYVRFSDDNGSTWSPRVRVNDDTVGNGKSQFLPRIALDQTSGNIAVSFYDCRNSAGNNQAEIWASASTDGGVTFAPNVKVSAGMSDGTVAGTGGFDFGDYAGLAFHAGAFYPCWADNSNSTGDNPGGTHNTLDIYIARVTVTGPPVIAGIQPTNLTVLVGQPAAFTVTAAGQDPLGYQWRLNGTLISGATSNVYSLAAAQASNSGAYTIVVTNLYGAATSGVATLTVIPTVPLPFALNNSNLTWTTDAATPWYGQTNISHDATAAAQTWVIADGQEASLRSTVTGPGTLTFWWKVSSQAGADFLTFRVGGSSQASISGEAGWEQKRHFLPVGALALEWVYAKNSSLSAGQDSGWVDQVSYTTGASLPFIITQPISQSSIGGTPVTFTVAADGTPTLTYQWRLNGSNIPAATASAFTLLSPLPGDVGAYSVVVANAYGSVLSSNAFFGVVPMLASGDDSLGQTRVSPAATNPVAIAAGTWHSLALGADGRVLAWGNNAYGQCDVPTNLSSVIGVAAGGYHSLALRANGTVIGWGANYNGQAAPPANLAPVVAVAAGAWHSLALRGDGTIVAWGDNSWGQTQVPAGLTGVIAIAAGGSHNLALRANGTVVAWGENTDPQGFFTGQSTVPGNVYSVVAIAAGDYHSLAVKADGSVVAWGYDSLGQCDVPANLTNVVAMAGGGSHSVALKSDGSVAAWGNNYAGQCNLPSRTTNVIAVAAGEYHTLLLIGNASGSLHLTHPSRTGTQFSVEAQTLSGKNYALEYKTSLTATNWTALPAIPGNGAVQLLTDPNATNSHRFYRVRQW